MANSPSHRFGQIIGDLLEEIIGPQLQKFCEQRGLFLDKKGRRGQARAGAKVSWLDGFGNSHDLDFVIEKGGTADTLGKPLAFIEVAWRRYTKHSRAKAQEIQGAVLPIADKHFWDKPFLGAVLAGVFTEASLQQMRSSGFETVLFPYDTVVGAFASIEIDVRFDETTPDDRFQRVVERIDSLSVIERAKLKESLVAANRDLFARFMDDLRTVLDRQLDTIVVIPLHGNEREFSSVGDAVDYIEAYNQDALADGVFRKYEVIVRYSNGDKIDASFQTKRETVNFLRYLGSGA
ncbi:hypothetical protein [Burkholderia gladioli]|uniref:hypothetical protein n=1 Tax=Burkholderia gladioli TaxID=28095 RepID=UPI0034DB13AC